MASRDQQPAALLKPDAGRRGERFYGLLTEVALPFANGAVPTLPVIGAQYQRLVEGVREIYPELEPFWDALKAGSTGYVTGAAILCHPRFAPTRTAIGLLSSRVGGGEARQEWIFGSTGDDEPVIYATLPDGRQETTNAKHINALASSVIASGTTDFDPYRTGGGRPRLGDHWPDWTRLSEDDLKRFLAEQESRARALAEEMSRPVRASAKEPDRHGADSTESDPGPG